MTCQPNMITRFNIKLKEIFIMNTIKSKLFIPGLLLVVASLSGCKEDVPALEYRTQGSIKGTISGTLSDDKTELNGNFQYNQFLPGNNLCLYEIEDDNSLKVKISRSDLNMPGDITIRFLLDDEDDTTPEVSNLSLQYNKRTSTQIINFTMYVAEFEISDFTFDIATGRTTGKITMEVDGGNNSTKNDAMVEITFDVVLEYTPYIFEI